MIHSKDCLYNLEQSFLDCTCGNDGEFREILASAYEWQNRPDLAELCRGGMKTYDICAALDAMRRVSTPIPLTPSDEMVALLKDCDGVIQCDPDCISFYRSGLRCTCGMQAIKDRIQAALNLMGGKK